MRRALQILAVVVALALAAGCAGNDNPGAAGGGPERGERSKGGAAVHGPGGQRGGFGGMGGGAELSAAVPVEVQRVTRRPISSYIETNGVLEAENEVDIVARTAGPIVKLNVEEGLRVTKGQVLAQIDDSEARAQLEISRVALNETLVAFERAKRLQQDSLISPETFEQASSAYEAARAQFEANQLVLEYTTIKAPFNGLIVRRYVDFAQQVSNNTPLFRISDFDPLLCPIQIPERDLRKLRLNQPAYLTLESFPDERFEASVLRISPIVDAATGTIKVTLEVRARDKLRPGMFARVFVETDTRPAALVIPKSALSLDSVGDTVYVAAGPTAARRDVKLGFREGDYVEVVSGLSEGDPVVVVGQDGLSDGTPIQVLKVDGAAALADGSPGGAPQSAAPGGRRPGFDPAHMSPEQLERVKQRMRERGLTEEQIAERLEQAAAPAEAE